MKIFCAYAFTGEDLEVVTARMRMVVDTLDSAGHEAYCNRFDPAVDELQEADDIQGIFKRAFQKVGESEALVAIVSSTNKSIGQIMEIGLALSQGKPVYLFENRAAKGSSYLPRLVSQTFEWDNLEDLERELKKIT